ncbi:hypothetical protein JZ751_020276 [Albula glossodonta]|uniref:Fibronectin type-III domain-containing protein n=1 Tax=Albula glossodonta TaxID=121402 RepID=A0A8T2MUN2_9TELE|nr:hypothetical protein JZ751_030018 [Albula glossodonta]KAG9331078.1 hypothetical protein JZ751_020276 [Albula glossodonta]
MATDLGPLTLLPLLYLCLGVCCALPAPINVSIVSFNLEHRLLWCPAPSTPPHTLYRVHCLHLRTHCVTFFSPSSASPPHHSEVTWKPILWCSKVDMGTLSCDLTDSFRESSSFYMARVQAFGLDHESNWTLSSPFNPMLDTVLGPPGVMVEGCGSCLRLQLSPPTGRGLQHISSPHLLSEFTCWVRKSGENAQFSLRVSSEEILVDYLQPGVEYCVTASVTSSMPSQVQLHHTAVPDPLSMVSVLPLESTNCRTYPCTPLYPQKEQQQKEEEEEEGYSHVVWEPDPEPCNDPLQPSQRPLLVEK